MKKLLTIAALVLSLSGVARSEDYLQGVIGPFGGLNNSDNSLIIPSTNAQDLLNVDITPGGKSVKKRKGFAQAFATTITTSPVHGVYTFYDEDGNDVVLAFNDRNVTASVAGGAATVIYSTATNDATWQCVDSQGFAYCANTARDGLFFTAGVSLGRLPVVSTGTIVAVTTERLAQAGFSATPNRIDISAANDFETWTVGADPTDPITFTITAPGSRITHLVYAHKKLYWFKESSFGYIIEGDTLEDWTVRAVSNEIGTLDNTSTQDTNGSLYFRGQDGHIYVTDGANVTKLSRDIYESIGNTITFDTLTLSAPSDWVAGTLSGYGGSTVFIDTETVAGNLQTTFPDTFSSYRDGTSSTKSVWLSFQPSDDNCSDIYETVSSVSGDLRFTVSTGPCTSAQYVRNISSFPNFSQGTTIQFTLDSSTLQYFEFGVSTVASVSIGSFGRNTIPFSYISVSVNSSAGQLGDTGKAFVHTIYNDGAELCSYPCSSDFSKPSELELWISDSQYSVSVNGVSINAGSHLIGSENLYVYFGEVSGGSGTLNVERFNIVPQTFTFISASQSVDSRISAWDSFLVTKDESGGSIDFSLRSDSGNPYVATEAGVVPNISTSTYWQLNSTFTFSNYDAEVPLSISDITQGWIEGIYDDKSYSVFHDDKVMFSVASGNGQTTNNRVLVYDLITPGWTIYDLAVNGFYRRNNSLYFGSSGGGYVYKFGDVDSDNGEAIEAYWKSKDFFLDAPFLEKDFVNISVAASQVSNSSMTVTYTVNGSSSNAYTVPLGNAGSTFVRNNKNLPAGRFGTTLNVQFGNDAEDQSFEVFGVGFGYRPRSWRPFP